MKTKVEYRSNNSGGDWCLKEALQEFEKITGQDVSDEGCNCCGAPHCLSWEDGYCSGEDCLKYLYKKVPSSLREACR